MQQVDRFLLAIVGGILVLVAAAFLFVLTRPEQQYQDDSTPQGAASNYLLALQRRDYASAYLYLDPELKDYPASQAIFHSEINHDLYSFPLDEDYTFNLVETSPLTPEEVTVVDFNLVEFQQGGLFDSGFQTSSTFWLDMRNTPDGWKVSDGTRFFASCWKNQRGCP